MTRSRTSAMHEKTKLLQEIGNRAKTAREDLCRMLQGKASDRLGYRNSSYLSKIESGSVNNLSVLTVRDMAILYDVSADYILGLTAEWETEVPRNSSNEYLVDLLERTRKRDMLVLAKLDSKVNEVLAVVQDLTEATSEVEQALNSLMIKAPEFNELPASKLVNRVMAAGESARRAKAVAARYRTVCKVASVDSLPLKFDEPVTEPDG